MNIYLSIIRNVVKTFPQIIPHLKGRARFMAFTRKEAKDYLSYIHGNLAIHRVNIEDNKTYDYFLSNTQRLVTSVYEGNLGGEFIDIMANLISGQLTQAYMEARQVEGGEGELPDYLTESLEGMILGQYEHVDQYYRDIVDARVDETPVEPLLARAELWANRWNEAYNQATLLIRADNGDNLEWVIGETEEHCPECFGLNGIVAKASEWEELNVHPQGAPNDKISCGGWKCDCSLSPTDKLRSPKAFESIMNIVSK